MKKMIIEAAIGIFGWICFCCICSEPADETPMMQWMLWELCWMAALVLDIKFFNWCDKKGLIDTERDEDK